MYLYIYIYIYMAVSILFFYTIWAHPQRDLNPVGTIKIQNGSHMRQNGSDMRRRGFRQKP